MKIATAMPPTRSADYHRSQQRPQSRTSRRTGDDQLAGAGETQKEGERRQDRDQREDPVDQRRDVEQSQTEGLAKTHNLARIPPHLLNQIYKHQKQNENHQNRRESDSKFPTEIKVQDHADAVLRRLRNPGRSEIQRSAAPMPKPRTAGE